MGKYLTGMTTSQIDSHTNTALLIEPATKFAHAGKLVTKLVQISTTLLQNAFFVQ